jgi:FtsH-binding integral membrane protein
MSADPRTPDRGRLALIRIALLVGVLTFGGLIYYQHSRPGWAPNAAVNTRTLRLTMQIVWIVGIAGVFVLFTLVRKVRDRAKYAQFSIIGWSIGEAIALLGAVFYYMTDDPRSYVLGLAAMMMTFFVFPVVRAE